MKAKRILSLLLMITLVFSLLTSCGTKKQSKVDFGDVEFVDFSQYKDSDDIPDWQGEKIKLVVWSGANGPNSQFMGKVSSNDLVTPEILRITGVEFDKENSFDNGGSSFDARIAKMIAAEEYPDIAYSIPDLTGLIDKGILYRLDEVVEQYAPNLYKLFGPDSKVYGDSWKKQMETYGGVYSISNSANHFAVRDIAEIDKSYDLTPEQINSMAGIGTHDYGYFYMRDDVLKALYPQAHTTAELEEIFKKNKKFTEEEIFDVPLEKPEDFVKLLNDVNKYIKDNNLKNTYATFTHTGGDNWPVLTNMAKVMGYNGNYFSYWDKESKQIKYTFKEDWFKDVLKEWNKLVRADVASQEALIDTDATFKEKLNSGKYIVTLQQAPNEEALAGKYRYRQVFCKYTYNKDKFVSFASDDSSISRISFFNTKLTEQQLIQAVRCLDFLASDAGQKLTYWGPKKAGLYTEDENGKLQYKDEKLKNDMLNSSITEEKLKYNLDSAAWPTYPKVVASKYYPALFYTDVKKYNSIFTPAYYERSETVKGNSADIYNNNFLAAVDGCKSFWAARNAFESALMKVFASADDNEFEANYKTMVDLATKNGLDDDTLKEANDYYKNNYNKDYMEYLK